MKEVKNKNLRFVAVDAATPESHFYVENTHISNLLAAAAAQKLVLFVGARQSGKTTDMQALQRRLQSSGYEVAFLLK